MTIQDRPAAEAAVRAAAAEDDAILVLRALAAGHPTLAYLPPDGTHEHVLTWMDDDGPRWEPRESAAELAAYARARFGGPDEHTAEPLPGTCYSVGPLNAARAADLRDPRHYPVEAVCRCAKRIVVAEWLAGAEWEHEERPGNAGG